MPLKKGHRRRIHILKQYIPSQLRAGQFGLFCLRNGRTMPLFISARQCIFPVFKFKTTTCIFLSSSNELRFISLHCEIVNDKTKSFDLFLCISNLIYIWTITINNMLKLIKINQFLYKNVSVLCACVKLYTAYAYHAQKRCSRLGYLIVQPWQAMFAVRQLLRQRPPQRQKDNSNPASGEQGDDNKLHSSIDTFITTLSFLGLDKRLCWSQFIYLFKMKWCERYTVMKKLHRIF